MEPVWPVTREHWPQGDKEKQSEWDVCLHPPLCLQSSVVFCRQCLPLLVRRGTAPCSRITECISLYILYYSISSLYLCVYFSCVLLFNINVLFYTNKTFNNIFLNTLFYILHLTVSSAIVSSIHIYDECMMSLLALF